jgi:hypothetical protein
VSTSLADVVAVACADAWRGDGEIFASGMGVMPMLGARLARATFEPDLMVSSSPAICRSAEPTNSSRVGFPSDRCSTPCGVVGATS